MKIKAIRASGLPVDKSQLEAYKVEWRSLVDRSADKCGKDMLRMQKLLARLEKIMSKKYTLIDEWNFRVSQKSLRELIDKYGDIRLAAARDDNSVVAVIMDDQEFMY